MGCGWRSNVAARMMRAAVLIAAPGMALAQGAGAVDYTISVTATSGPGGTLQQAWFEHFEDPAASAPPGGWFEVDNTQIRADGLGSARIVIADASDPGHLYGHVSSNNDLPLNFTDNHVFRVVITEVDPNTGNIFYLQEYVAGAPTGPRKEIARNLGVGIHDGIDINAVDPWAGTKTFAIEVVVEAAQGSSGSGLRIDDMQIYGGADAASFVEDFDETTAGQSPPGGWWEVVNADLAASGAGSVRLEALGASPVYCEIESNNDHQLDFSSRHFLRLVLPAVDTDIGNIFFLQEYVGGVATGSRKEIARNLGPGVHSGIDINATDPWTGTKTFSVIMVVESGGVAGKGMQVDSMRITAENQ
jgi:hypothetical protein